MLSSIAARILTALCGVLVILAVSAPASAEESPEFTFKDGLFCQFVSQHTGNTKVMMSLWKYNRNFATSQRINSYDLNSAMVFENSRAVMAIHNVMGNTDANSVEAANIVFKSNRCDELYKKLRGLRDS